MRAVVAALLLAASLTQAQEASSATATVAAVASVPRAVALSTPVWGVHLTGWTAGSPRERRKFIDNMKRAGLNTVVIALKEYDGRLFVRGIPLAHELGAFVNAIPDLERCVNDFKEAGIYTIGRIVLMKDNTLARKRPDLAVKKPDGSLWTNDKGVAWVDPYRKEVWAYNLAVAQKAAPYFDEIQFDYIRFPSDGPVSLCRYSRADHTPATAARNLADLMAYFRKNLPGKPISVAVFGLTTTDTSGMGIGQRLAEFVQNADFVCPMMYPSHYNRGEYGIKDPNKSPYRTIKMGLRKAAALGADVSKLRPYLQDFSMGHRYGPNEVRAQILAAARMGVRSWILWNPQNRYTWSAIPKLSELPPAAPDSPDLPEKETP
jgi:hypothetical protein